MPDTPTPLNLDTIRAIAADLDAAINEGDPGRASLALRVAAQVPDLLAEAERLREERDDALAVVARIREVRPTYAEWEHRAIVAEHTVNELLAARPAPAWDEEAVQGALVGAQLASVRRVMDDGYPSIFIRSNEDAADAALAVVREHLPVKPDREAVIERLAARWWDLNTGDTDTWESLTPDEREAVVDNENLGPLADAALDLWPGRSEAEVKREGAVEALREAARKADGLGIISGSSVNVGDRASAWLSARADRLAAEGGAGRG